MSRSQKLLVATLILGSSLANADDDWDFRLSPYLWFAGIQGDVSTIPGAPVAPIDISSSDALNDTEASLMLVFEAKRQRHGVLVDALYTDVQSKTDIAPAIGLRMKSTSKNTVFSVSYEYEMYNSGQASADVFAGARYWNIDTKLQFEGGLGVLAGRRVQHKESWVDPMIGIKGRTRLGDSQFFLSGALAIGGFGVGSDSFYDVLGNIGYQWTDAIGTTIGYRLYDLDYEDGGFVYDVRQQGMTMALTWAF